MEVAIPCRDPAAGFQRPPGLTKSPRALYMMSDTAQSQEETMRARTVRKQECPDSHSAHGAPFTGIPNARPETQEWSMPPVELKNLSFDPMTHMEYELPHEPVHE